MEKLKNPPMADLTKEIAAAKAKKKCRGPWLSTCDLCGGRYSTPKKLEHLENDCPAYRKGVVLKKKDISQSTKKSGKKNTEKRQVREALREMQKVRVVRGSDGVFHAFADRNKRASN